MLESAHGLVVGQPLGADTPDDQIPINTLAIDGWNAAWVRVLHHDPVDDVSTPMWVQPDLGPEVQYYRQTRYLVQLVRGPIIVAYIGGGEAPRPGVVIES